jgi:hypothetical protein
VSTATRNRLLIPARRRASRERLFATLPFFLRDPAADPQQPSAAPLLSFESDTFVDDFLALAAGRGRLPRLLPWRDWSEPPGPMLDGPGVPGYPGTIARFAPIGHQPEPPAEEIDADGIPGGTPPWLRKLYLPLHERFTMVAFDLVCDAPGWPRVDRARVLESGAVIRRLVADRGTERWQDWIALDEKRGLWLELLDGGMAPLAGGAPADPRALPAAATAAHEGRLKSLLRIPAAEPLGPVGLASAPLALIPPDTGEAGRHCSLFGYLPLFSAAQSVPETELEGRSEAELVVELAARVRIGVTAAFAAEPGLLGQIQTQVRQIMDDAVLPDAPASGGSTNARDLILLQVRAGATAPVPEAALRAAVDWLTDRAVEVAVLRCWEHAAARTTLESAVAGTSRGGQGHWTAAEADRAARGSGMPDAADIAGEIPALAAQAQIVGGGDTFAERLRSTCSSQTTQWDVLVRGRLNALVAGWLAAGTLVPGLFGHPARLEQAHVEAVLGLAVLRLRLDRLTLAAHFMKQMGGDAPLEPWDAEEDRPAYGAAQLAAVIEETDTLESTRGNTLGLSEPPWPEVTGSGLADPERLRRVHAAGLALETLYSELHSRLDGAGSAVAPELEDRRREAEERIGGLFDSGASPAPEVLSPYGLESASQPALGLLAFPGAHFGTAQIQAFGDAAAGRYTSDGRQLIAAEQRRAKAPRLRFDADHLYAVWCWARIAGRDPCEPERIVWTPRGEPFTIADPTDLLGARPASIRMPDIPRLLRDLPRLAKAQAHPFAAVAAPDNSGISTGEDMADTRRQWGVGFICSFGIPVITICALVLFNIIFHILIVLPGFMWMLLLKFCIPFPRRES